MQVITNNFHQKYRKFCQLLNNEKTGVKKGRKYKKNWCVIRLDDGTVITEGAIIMQYIADSRGATSLLPAVGQLDRYKTLGKWFHPFLSNFWIFMLKCWWKDTQQNLSIHNFGKYSAFFLLIFCLCFFSFFWLVNFNLMFVHVKLTCWHVSNSRWSEM